MAVFSFDDFVSFYRKKGYCPGDVNRSRKNGLTDAGLLTKYQSYVRREEKKKENLEKRIERRKVDPVQALDSLIRERDGNKCRFLARLEEAGDDQSIEILLEYAGDLAEKLDKAHVFGKGAFPHLRSCPDNIVLLNRYSHTMLDSHRHPVTGTPLSREDHESLWAWIVGYTEYKKLKIKAYNRRRVEDAARSEESEG